MAEPEGVEGDLDALVVEGAEIGGKYVVRTVIGRGGMGVVVECWHPDLGRRVAVKLLRERSDDRIARFLREARLAASLQSEHVARVLDAGRAAGGVPFMVLEYLEGRDLDAELAERVTLPIPLAVLFVLQAAEAIAEAHERGIVHRDLKPSNLFLAERLDGSVAVKVLDFGISKSAIEVQGTVTETGTLLGTPLYMSPEQVRDPRDADPRSDLWALGVILHELVSGRLPFTGASLPALGAAIVSDPPIELREAAPDAPEELEKVVLRCLEKDPSRRYQSVADFARALVPFAPDEGAIHVRRIAALSGASMRSGRHRIDSLPVLDAPTIDPDASTIAASADQRADTRRDAGSLAASVSPPPRVARRSRLLPLVALPIALIALAGIWIAVKSRTGEAPLSSEPSAAREPDSAERRAPVAPTVREPVRPVVSVAIPSSVPSASDERPSTAPPPPSAKPRTPVPATAKKPAPLVPKSTDDMLRYRK